MKMMRNQEEKKKLYKDIDAKTKVISHPTSVNSTMDIIARGFPGELFSQWREDCKLIYNDIYWAKMWSDHLKAQAYDNLTKSAVEKQDPEQEISENEDIPTTGDGSVIENG